VPDNIDLADPQALPQAAKYALYQVWREFGYSYAHRFNQDTGQYAG
jgi:hypothetical protein